MEALWRAKEAPQAAWDDLGRDVLGPANISWAFFSWPAIYRPGGLLSTHKISQLCFFTSTSQLYIFQLC